MTRERHSRAAQVFTDLVLEVFRLNGTLLAAGDRLTQDVGLTSARWQVLGSVALAQMPQPVSHLARTMGLTRQAVQRIANELRTAGLVTFAPNPHHQRAQLVVMTPKGQAVYDAALRKQIPWANAVTQGYPGRSVLAALQTLRALRERLESDRSAPRRRGISPAGKGGRHAGFARDGSKGQLRPTDE